MTEADRDADGKIRVTPSERHLADLLPPAPASAVGEETRGVRLGRLELAGSVAGLMLALALVVLVGRVFPAGQEAPAPAVAPALPAPSTAQPSPMKAPTTTPAPTATAEPPTATPEPLTPIVVVQPPPPPITCYTITLDVTDEHGYPIGIAEGYSCESQDAARANAAAQADLVKAAQQRRRR